MKLSKTLQKCIELGDEKVTTNHTTYTYTENEYTHVLQVFNRNCGKNKTNDAVYSRTIDGCVVYEWQGQRADLFKD